MKKLKTFFLLSTIYCLLTTSAWGLDLKALQEELHRRGDPWVAGTTSVSELSFEEKQKIFSGMVVPPGYEKIEPPFKPYQTQAPPSKWDWRDVNGHNWMTPVKDQGMCGSCWAFATIAALESRMKIQNNMPNINPDLSEQFLVSCDPYDGGCGGGLPINACRFIKETGVSDEACFPYVAWDAPCNNRCPDWGLRVIKISDYGQLPEDALTIKNEIMEGGPLAIGVTAKEDFFYYKGGVYEPIMGEWMQANHAVCLCGWNDAGGYWIVKNSWGTWWGDGSYANISNNYGWQAEWPVWMKPAGALGAITVYNKSFATTDLTVSNITNSAAWIKFVAPKNFTISPADSQIVFINVSGDQPVGTYSDVLKIWSNDPDDNPYPVFITLEVTETGKKLYTTSDGFNLKCYSNPASKKLTIKYTLPSSGNTRLTIYDVAGREVKSILNDELQTGIYIQNIDVRNLISGVYFLLLRQGKEQATQKVVLQ